MFYVAQNLVELYIPVPSLTQKYRGQVFPWPGHRCVSLSEGANCTSTVTWSKWAQDLSYVTASLLSWLLLSSFIVFCIMIQSMSCPCVSASLCLFWRFCLGCLTCLHHKLAKCFDVTSLFTRIKLLRQTVFVFEWVLTYSTSQTERLKKQRYQSNRKDKKNTVVQETQTIKTMLKHQQDEYIDKHNN